MFFMSISVVVKSIQTTSSVASSKATWWRRHQCHQHLYVIKIVICSFLYAHFNCRNRRRPCRQHRSRRRLNHQRQSRRRMQRQCHHQIQRQCRQTKKNSPLRRPRRRPTRATAGACPSRYSISATAWGLTPMRSANSSTETP